MLNNAFFVCLEPATVENKSGHGGLLSDGHSPQNLVGLPGQILWPQGQWPSRGPASGRGAKVSMLGNLSFGEGDEKMQEEGSPRSLREAGKQARVLNQSKGAPGLGR